MSLSLSATVACHLLIQRHIGEIIGFMEKHRLPAMYQTKENVKFWRPQAKLFMHSIEIAPHVTRAANLLFPFLRHCRWLDVLRA